MKNITITLSEEEVNTLFNSLDINIRTNGLKVSAECTILAEKINSEYNKQNEVDEPEIVSKD